jgi:hypothetical protein
VGPTQLSYSMSTVSYFPGAEETEGPGRETHYSASCTAEAKNEWNATAASAIRLLGVTPLRRPKDHS